MKRLILSFGLLLPLFAFAQEVNYPYNPDENGDQYISTPDLMEFLVAFGQDWVEEEIVVDSIPLEVYLQTLNMMIQANALPEGTAAGQFLKWDGEEWVLVVPKVGCTDPLACTYDDEATTLMPSMCEYLDDCGVCNGPGAVYPCGCTDYPPGACDCEGNDLDALGVCGGPCLSDADGDGICDDDGVDECVGLVDECGICNGPGAVYACGCFEIPSGFCDCDGGLDADEDGICDLDDECVGTVDAAGVCNGECLSDVDGDGVCDDNGNDPCFGELDACGVCNGPGPVYECGCQDLLPGACDCAGSMMDDEGNCQDCLTDANGDGIFDTVCGPCLGQTTIHYQGHDYGLVEIGGRCWFKENLTATAYQDGSAIQEVQDLETWNGLSEVGAYIIYGEDSIYGKLYNGYAAARNLCPQYWGLPEVLDWEQLIDSLGGLAVAGGKMKESGFSHWNIPNGGASNESGFTALPAGERMIVEPGVQGLGDAALFWSSGTFIEAAGVTEPIIQTLQLSTSTPVAALVGHSIQRGHSVRCLRQANVLGCTNPEFMEFNPLANLDDGSCNFPAVLGCTDDQFVEYDASANMDDGTCSELVGCENGAVVNFDGHDYEVVTIGDQCWFAENLRSTTYANGEPIQGAQNDDEWQAMANQIGLWCHYNYDASNDSVKGKLYNWYAAVDSRGLCPSGWKVPDSEDWNTLFQVYGGAQFAGAPLKASSEDVTPWNGTNVSGFNAIQAGRKRENTGFGNSSNAIFMRTYPTNWGFNPIRLDDGEAAGTYNMVALRSATSVRCLRLEE